MIKAILCCGSGASSGFMSQAIKKAAKKQCIEIDVKACSESLLEQNLESTDVVLIAPHLQAEKDAIAKRCGDVPTVVIDKMAYGMLDGDTVLKQINETVKTQKEGINYAKTN